ncbi:MAG: dihydroneopterin aldolase [Actinobacteria bacterium]|jgi:dihydroneopterin aldolase|uniref:dihydroneopterin aldolase n=1 Tax=freshwater metagenome TaxID=449393 RepID=A0A6J7KGG7_9ZZZZ|nr:dihydroneopterin aldolase [Actinomycetota bacterium]MSX99980.1 dihydroneopterin aldolase [Actinomycetota bacterium]
MADLIRITGIKGFGYHGVFDSERANGQDFYVDVDLEVDLTRASVSDDVKDTINYAEVTDLVVEEITTNPVSLIEKLAGRIAERIKVTFAQASRVTITVHKPQAPVDAEVKDISVTISR